LDKENFLYIKKQCIPLVWWELSSGMIKLVRNEFFKRNTGWKVHLAVNTNNQRNVYE